MAMPSLQPVVALVKKNGKFVALGAVFFCLGLVWNFPFDRIKEVIQARIFAQSRVVLEISSIKPALPLGFEFVNPKVSNVQLGAKTLAFDLDSLSLTVSPWSALTFALARSGTLHYAAEKQTFRASGGLSTGKKSTGFSTKLKNLKIDEKFPLPSSDPFSPTGLEVGFAGNLEGDLDVELDTAGMQKQDYSSLQGDGKITLGSARVAAPMLGPLEFSKIVLDVKADKGAIDIKSITLAGAKISGKGSGSIKINPFFPQSTLRIDATISFGEEAAQLKSLVQTMGASAGFTMDAAGNVPIKITGTIGQPSLKGY